MGFVYITAEQLEDAPEVAILKVAPSVSFHVGYKTATMMQVFETPGQTHNGLFGMRVGDDPITFFVIAEDFSSNTSLELVELTSINNSEYDDVPLF